MTDFDEDITEVGPRPKPCVGCGRPMDPERTHLCPRCWDLCRAAVIEDRRREMRAEVCGTCGKAHS